MIEEYEVMVWCHLNWTVEVLSPNIIWVTHIWTEYLLHVVIEWPLVWQITMFIYTEIGIEQLKKHFTRILRTTLHSKFCTHTASMADSHDTARTQYLNNRYTYPLVGHYSVPMNTSDSPSLCRWTLSRCCTRMLTRSSPQDSLSASHTLYRREKIPSPSAASSLYHHEETPFHPLLARCVSVRRLPVHLLTLAHIALSSFSIFPNSSRKRYPSFSRKHETALVVRLFNSQALAQQQVGLQRLPGCILLGVAASR
jgi:hypothetical protein